VRVHEVPLETGENCYTDLQVVKNLLAEIKQ